MSKCTRRLKSRVMGPNPAYLGQKEAFIPIENQGVQI
jgi:hypothetical protein